MLVCPRARRMESSIASPIKSLFMGARGIPSPFPTDVVGLLFCGVHRQRERLFPFGFVYCRPCVSLSSTTRVANGKEMELRRTAHPYVWKEDSCPSALLLYSETNPHPIYGSSIPSEAHSVNRISVLLVALPRAHFLNTITRFG